MNKIYHHTAICYLANTKNDLTRSKDISVLNGQSRGVIQAENILSKKCFCWEYISKLQISELVYLKYLQKTC